MMSYMITCILLAASMPQESTIRINLPALVDEVTFNPTTTSADDVRRFMQLSPNVSPFNGYLVPESLESCKADDPRYHGCGVQNGVSLHNAKLNLENIQKRIQDLSRTDYPPELSAIVAYLKTIQQFAFWRGSQELAYLRTGDVTPLESQFGGVSPKTSCAKELQGIRVAPDKGTANKIARFDWVNCVWKAEMDQIGPYPKDAWQTFLAAHAIREKPIEESPDR
jgi:hypothetical protein